MYNFYKIPLYYIMISLSSSDCVCISWIIADMRRANLLVHMFFYLNILFIKI